jgi:hypothetical protein
MAPTTTRFSVCGLCITLLGAWVCLLQPAPAAAQFGFPGNPVRILNDAARALNRGVPSNRGSSARHSREPSQDDGNDRPAKKNEQSDAEATARFAKQLAAIQAELQERSRAEHMELERNVDKTIEAFITTLTKAHEDLRNQGNVHSTRGEINQVTAGQIRSSIEDAYDKANLREFEQFTGELWTRDRLMVRILRSASRGLGPYFEGVGAKGPTMDDLKDLFQKSARQVFAKALETSEIIGVSKSFDRFIRTIYEQSDGLNGLWSSGADGKYEQLTSLAINEVWQEHGVEKAGGAVVADAEGLKRQFLFRFRARRALYECLSITYQDLLRGGSGGTGTVTTGYTTTTGPVSQRGLSPIGPAMAPAAEAALWQQVTTHVGKACRGKMPTILAEAKGGLIQPVSSRESGLPVSAVVVPVGDRR